jgi:hypothetical protein
MPNLAWPVALFAKCLRTVCHGMWKVAAGPGRCPRLNKSGIARHSIVLIFAYLTINRCGYHTFFPTIDLEALVHSDCSKAPLIILNFQSRCGTSFSLLSKRRHWNNTFWLNLLPSLSRFSRCEFSLWQIRRISNTRGKSLRKLLNSPVCGVGAREADHRGWPTPPAGCPPAAGKPLKH